MGGKLRRTKIICTMGPSVDDPEVLRKLLEIGFDVARINTAHGTPEEHGARIARVREVAAAVGRPIGVLIDLPGPKFRLGDVEGGSMELRRGDEIILGADWPGGKKAIPVTYPRLAQEMAAGEALFLNDGTVRLRVKEIMGGAIRCEVEIGGTARSHSGINLPESKLSVTLPTEDDVKWIAFGCAHHVEWIGVSFVRTAVDVQQVRKRLSNGQRPMIMAKIEKRQALEHLKAIIDAADGVMVARGDLGVETPLAEVPIAQKRIIAMANERGKPVVTATQMLESMVEHGSPTRAEVTDVANAVLDGTDAVMLSAETAIGRYPVEAVRVLDDVIHATEQHYPFAAHLDRFAQINWSAIADAVSFVACRLAVKVGAKAIVVPLESPATAFRLSRFHPKAPVIALCRSAHTAHQLTVAGGVITILLKEGDTDILANARQCVIERELGQRGDLAILVFDTSKEGDQTSDSVQVVTL